MKKRLNNFKIGGGALIDVVVYENDGDYFCRLSRSEDQTQSINDAFVPPPEIGALWLRQRENRWLISGLVKKTNFPRKQDIHDLVYFILESMLNVNEMAHIRIDRVEYKEDETLQGSMEEVDV